MKKIYLCIYLIGTAFLMCFIGTFNSCINGVDDEYLELRNSGNGGGDQPGEEEELPDLNGDYYQGGDFELTMTYNGGELTGKKVNVTTDELNETAIITLSGSEQDLSELVGGLLEFKITTYSPIPGVKELTLPNVKLYYNNNSDTESYMFKGEHIESTYTLRYEGIIEDGKMDIELTHMLVRQNNDLLGKWKLEPGKQLEAGGSLFSPGNMNLINNNRMEPKDSSPLFLDWGSKIKVSMGAIPTGMSIPATITPERPMTGIFNLLMSNVLNPIILPPHGLEKSLPRLIEFIAAEETGGMYASYAWNDIALEEPLYSQNMSHNIIRYFWDENDKPFIEINVDFLKETLGGLLGGGGIIPMIKRTDAADPEVAKAIGRELIAKLTPALEKGIPVEYTIEGNNMSINIEGKFFLDVVKTLSDLVNDEYIKEAIYPAIEGMEGMGAYANAIKNLLKNMQYAVQYQDATKYEDGVPIDPTGECEYIKLGLRLIRM